MFFTIDQRNALANKLFNKNNVQRLFEATREGITKMQARAEVIERQVKGQPVWEAMVYQSKMYSSDMNFFVDIIEAIALNHIKDHELLLKLIEAFIQKDEQRDKAVKELKDTISQQQNEINELMKHKEALEWAENYIKHSTETSPE